MGSSVEMTGFVGYINDDEILGAFAKMRKAIINVVSVRPPKRLSEWNDSAPTGRIFIKSDIYIYIYIN